MKSPGLSYLRSLQVRLLLSTSLASSAILALLGFSVYGFMWYRLLDEFNAGMLTKARAIAGMVELNGSSITFDADLDQLPEFASGKNAEYFEIWLSDGKVLARSRSLHGKDLPRSAPQPEPRSTPLLLPDGHKGRLITVLFPVHAEHDDDNPPQPATNQTAIVALAARPLIVNQTLDDLGWLLCILCAAAVMLAGAVLVLIVRNAMKPINRLAIEIGSLGETDLSRRLNAGGVPIELTPVIDKLNGLLGRLDESFTREKAFTADVAHELRTPLAGIATTLEVCRTRPRESAAYESAIDECRSMTARLQSLIESLLLLARADAGQLAMHREPIDLHHLMRECWLPLIDRAGAKKLVVRNTNAGDCVVNTDAEKLRIILRNLLDNAVSHVPVAGSVQWSVNGNPSSVVVELINTGSQVSQAEAGRLFDRFYRGDPSRTDTGTHCGLGLSLCQRLVRLLGGTIQIQTDTGADFLVRLEIPVEA